MMVTKKIAPSTELQSVRKWGAAVMGHGQCILPSLLLRAQARLSLSSTEMMVLLQLIEHWWKADSDVYPSMQTIASRIAMTPKTVQRAIDVLVEKHYITKSKRKLPGGGNLSNEYKFDGLVAMLKSIEVDFRRAKNTMKAAAEPGGLTANKVT